MTRRRRRQPEPKDYGTPETARKLKADVIEKLRRRPVEKHGITDLESKAANEIRDVYEAWSRAMFGGSGANLERVDCTVLRDPIERLGAREHELWAGPFTQWIKATSGKAPGTSRSYHGIVRLVAVDNFGPWQVRRMLGSKPNTVLPALRRGLQAWIEIRGWQ